MTYCGLFVSHVRTHAYPRGRLGSSAGLRLDVERGGCHQTVGQPSKCDPLYQTETEIRTLDFHIDQSLISCYDTARRD